MFTAAELAFMTISFPPGLVQRCPVTRVAAWTSGHSYRTVAHLPAAARMFAPAPGWAPFGGLFASRAVLGARVRRGAELHGVTDGRVCEGSATVPETTRADPAVVAAGISPR